MSLRFQSQLMILTGLIVVACGKPVSTQTKTSSNSSATTSTSSSCQQLATDAVAKTSFTTLSLTSDNSDFAIAADAMVADNINPLIRASARGTKLQFLNSNKIRDYDLSLANMPFCRNDLAVFERPNHTLWLKGNIPDLGSITQEDVDQIPNLVFPSLNDAVSQVYSQLNLTGAISSPKLIKQCIIFENEAFTPASEVAFTVDRKPYKGIATTQDFALVSGTDSVRSAYPAYLEEATTTTSATATVAIGGTGTSVSGSSLPVYKTQSVDLASMSTDGTLCSQEFVSVGLASANAKTLELVTASDGNFTFPQTDWRFFAATTYYNASSHVKWLVDNKYITNWPGPQVQIVLNLSDTGDTGTNGMNNTAVFYPNSNNLKDPPQIELGNGDGSVLMNLWTEPDAVKHETGHHLIYTTLTDIGDTISVVIHEGFADAQVLLEKQSPCLCPTVCPTGSYVCFSSQCLRSAANNYTMAAPSCVSGGATTAPQCLPSEVHQRSQVISGMMWDIAQAIGPANNGYQIALELEMRAINYFAARTEYGELLEALIKADEDMGGKYQSIILREMCARGFDAAQNNLGTGSWMNMISVSYTCPSGSSNVPTSSAVAPATSGAFSVSTTANGGS